MTLRVPRLFTLADVRPRHPNVERWFASHPGPLGVIATRWFEVFRASGSDVCEVLHDSQPTACVGSAAFGYVAIYRAHVNVGFFDGARLPDPHRLLQGNGRFMRHASLSPEDNVDEPALAALIQAAYAEIRTTLAASADRAT